MPVNSFHSTRRQVINKNKIKIRKEEIIIPLKFRIKKPKELDSTLTELKREAGRHSIAFTGDEKSGRGSGYGFEAIYTVFPNEIEMTVLRKPFWASESMVRSELEKYFGNRK